jgi:multidrug efflux pump subunit AcrA (membrane-fusion protein)
MLAPYQQAVSGTGQVIAYAQEERSTPINAPIEGRVVKWHVKEGQIIKKGDPIVDILDNDPNLYQRLTDQKVAVQKRQSATRERITALTENVKRLEQARDEAIKAASERLEAVRRDVITAENAQLRAAAALELAEENYRLQENCYKDSLGLTSRIDFLRAKMEREDRRAAMEQAKAGVSKSNDMVRAMIADVQRVTNSENAIIQGATANLEIANDALAGLDRDLLEIEIRLSRQGQQRIVSEVDGMVHQVSAKSTTGQLVKAGELLVEIVPDTTEPVVELLIDGNDMPLLLGKVGQHVRLQFEGYPAVQFVGWPSVAIGTFGGKVKVIDPTDDGKGKFRILVEPDPDPDFEDDNWPGLDEARAKGTRNILLRQGQRANGWVFLNRVTLGWELWRRINGFPPVVASKEPGKDDTKPPKFLKKAK